MAPPVESVRAASASRRRTAQTAALIAAILGLYFFVGIGAGDHLPTFGRKGRRETDYFNLLSHGFLNGHLYLAKAPPPELARLANPYDPAQREGIPWLHDASYYRGRYYIYFGPAPVVTLFLPFTLLTDLDLPVPWAVWIFSSAGYVALLGSFFHLQQRSFPAASSATGFSALLVLGTGTLLLAVLRRSAIWEVSVACGFCYFTLSLFALVRALDSRRAIRWAAAGGIALGLAVASRPTYLAAAPLFALPLWLRGRYPAFGRDYGWRAVLAAGTACGVIGAALAAYNYARFGNALEFGMTYQLSGMGEVGRRHFDSAFLQPNFYYYFVSALRWTNVFPFVSEIAPVTLPAGHGGHEYSFGLFRNLPFAWFGLAAIAGFCGWGRDATEATNARPVLALIAAAAVLTSILPLFFFGSCIRYMVDFAPCMMLLAALGLLYWEAQLQLPLALLGLRVAGVGLAVVTSVIAFLAIANLYNPVPEVPAPGFRALARLGNAPMYSLRARQWPDYGPVELDLSFPADRTNREEPIYSVAPDGHEAALIFVEYVAARSVRFGYREAAHGGRVVYSPVVSAEPGARHVLRLAVGGPYADYDGAKCMLRAQFDAQALWDRRCVSVDVCPGKVSLGEGRRPGAPNLRFTGIIHSKRKIGIAEIGGSFANGVHVEFTVTPDLLGRSWPIVTRGTSGAADTLFLRIRPTGQAAFGYDHWGLPSYHSAEFHLSVGEHVAFDAWLPPVATRQAEGTVVVRLRGAGFWRERVLFFQAKPESVFLGANLIGATSCETTFAAALCQSVPGPPPEN